MSISPGLTVDIDILHHSSYPFITHPIPGLEPSNPRPTVVAPYVPCSGVLGKKLNSFEMFFFSKLRLQKPQLTSGSFC